MSHQMLFLGPHHSIQNRLVELSRIGERLHRQKVLQQHQQQQQHQLLMEEQNQGTVVGRTYIILGNVG